MREFRLGTHVRIGADALSALDQFATRRVFLVTDAFLATTPVFADVESRLGDRVTRFTDVVPNPTIATVSKGVGAYLQARPDVVVAYGGGSVMDAAKAMHKAALDSGFGATAGLVAISTTSGSGSEVTSFAVLTDERTHTKIPLVSPDMVAKLAILDPDAVVGVPPRITADSGMDVLTHAVEAYVSLGACDFSDALAEKAVELVFAHLVRCYTHGDDRDARGHMHNASCLAAMAFDNVGLGITHSLAHALGGRFPIAHGRLNDASAACGDVQRRAERRGGGQVRPPRPPRRAVGHRRRGRHLARGRDTAAEPPARHPGADRGGGSGAGRVQGGGRRHGRLGAGGRVHAVEPRATHPGRPGPAAAEARLTTP